MSFSGQSNPPWQRNNLSNVLQGQLGGNAAVGQLPNAGMAFHQGNAGQIFLQQAQQNMGYSHGSLQSSGSAAGMYQQGSSGGSASISYPPARTGLNPVAFQNSAHSGQMQGHRAQQQHQPQQQHYNSIGTVTKISPDCGLVNEEVFFYRNVCKGHIPKLGDRVLFEASFSPNGQFKWNATRIQLMPQPGVNSNQPAPLMSGGKKGSSGYNAVPPPNEYQHLRAQQRKGSPRRSSPTGRDRHQRSERDRRDRDRSPRRRDADEDENDRKRRREEPGRSKERTRSVASRSDRERERDREREDTKREQDQIIMERRKALTERERERDREREREREKDRERSPVNRGGIKPRNIRRTIRRYMVQIPKIVLTIKNADVQHLRQRYSTLYIPSDFFHAEVKWPQSFTHANPFSLRRPCKFHIKNKSVEPLGGIDQQNIEPLEPEDADYSFSAKVMLLACPPIAELYQKSFEAEDDTENEQHSVHPSRLISFLVGTRGRNEPMAIGGPWSPSLDGENPDKDPTVLIRTAIRTCKALTGIDLSNCTQWYRFLELYYHRSDHKTKDQDVPPRIETVVMYLPDVHSCVPTVSEWENLVQDYKTAVENIISVKTENSKQASASSGADEAGTATLANDFNNTDAAADAEPETAEEEAEPAAAENKQATLTSKKADEDQNEVMDISSDGDENATEKEDKGPEPTHFSQLDLKAMKVQEIRNELIARNLPSRGLRNLLMARLAKALNAEKEEEEANAAAIDETTELNEAVDEIEEIIDCDSDDNNEITENDGKVNASDTEEVQSNHDEAAAEDEQEEAEEEHEDWADVDMNDIVILDEYDSSKNPEEAREFDEKEKMHLIRRYTLPSTPQIIVHPSKTAKGGKFDCTTMSLSVLLDYRPEDTKERFFEVSLFAELFNEMLMRDFGFNIYKALYLHKEPNPIEVTEQTDDSSNNKKDENKSNVDEEKLAKDKNGGSPPAESKSKERRISKHDIDADPTDEDNQSSKSSSDRKRKASEKSSVDKKTFIVKPQLLLSFIYFDTTHCGYIFEKDLEDLFSILGLYLSRGQIRRVLGKSASRQAIYYRKLTDKEDLIDAPPSIEESDDISNEDLKKIAMGNKQYYPIFNSETSETINNDNIADDNNGLTNYNGAVIHVGKLVEQIKRTETSFSDLEKLYNDLRKQYGDLQKEHSKSSGKIKDLQSEVRSLNRKISDTDQDLYTVNRKYKDQNATLSYIYHKVAPYFSREEEKKHKSESSRDKENDKQKEKDYEKTAKDKVESKDDEKDKTNIDREKSPDNTDKQQSENSVDAKTHNDKKGETKKAKET